MLKKAQNPRKAKSLFQINGWLNTVKVKRVSTWWGPLSKL